jgi:Bacterial membrane protein YfhO
VIRQRPRCESRPESAPLWQARGLGNERRGPVPLGSWPAPGRWSIIDGVSEAREDEESPTRSGRPEQFLRRWGPVLAGPLLIVAAVLVVHHRFAFGGMVTTQHIDILPMWLPTHCFLGRSLAAGHVPAWNPHGLSGTPFAADPQSGWMYLPAMSMYAALSCDVAIRWFIVLQPILAGLGVFGLLRGEEVSHPSAAVGGVAIAMVMAGSYASLALPFAGAVAWTAVLLAAASWYLRARTWPARLVLAAAAALAWGQVGAAHLSHGLVIGTGALVVYLAARSIADPLQGRRRMGEVVASATILLAALPLVNLAVLLPRLAYLPDTSIALGYPELIDRIGRLAGLTPIPFRVGPAAAVEWPLWLSSPPGSYMGMAALVLAFAGLANRRRWPVAAGFALFGAACYLLSLEAVALSLQPHLQGVPFGDFYLHDPDRFRYGVLVAIPVLAGLGLETWREARSLQARVALLAPGAVVWLLLPWQQGIERPEAWVAILGLALGAAALAVTALRPALALLVPAVLAVELVASGLAGQGREYAAATLEEPNLFEAFPPLRRPSVEAAQYLEPGPIVMALAEADAGRFVPHSPEEAKFRGYLELQEERYWPLLTNQRATVFGLDDAGGYNPTQLVRYWEFVRAADPKRIRYNAAFFRELSPVVRDLLRVAFAVAPSGTPPVPGAERVAEEGGYELYRLPGDAPLATAVSSWEVAESDGEALLRVIGDGFDPGTIVVLEEDPGLPQPDPGEDGASTGVDVEVLGAQAIRVRTSGAAAVLLVRIPYHDGWKATVDGSPVRVLPADFVVMGVPVPAGNHVVEIGYDEPAIGLGLLGSALSLMALLATAAGVRWRKIKLSGRGPRELRRQAPPTPVAEPAATERAGG